MIKIAFIDDSKEQQAIYDEYMSRYQKDHMYDYTIDKYYDGDDLVFNFKANYDIIFLDVEMERMNGIDTANFIRKQDENVIIVFVTNMAQYAIKGYSVKALDYLLKPITYYGFEHILTNSIELLKQSRKSFLLVTNKDETTKIDTSTIMFIESIGHKVKIVTKDKDYFMAATIKDIENDLKNRKQFFRSNKCYIVNLAYVTKTVEDCAVIDKHNLLISKRRKKEFMTALTEYIGGI